MKKIVSVVYTVFVVVTLLCIISFFGWKTYQSRAVRISNFVARTDEYTLALSKTMEERRDVDTEVTVAETFMDKDPSLIAVQVYSHDDGLRLSVVKSVAVDFSRKPIVESDRFNKFTARFRYYTKTRSLEISGIQGLEATFVATVLSDTEIRSNLMIILIAVAGFFVITLALILFKAKRRINTPEEEMQDSFPGEYSGGEDDVDFSEISPVENLDDRDFFGNEPESNDSMFMEDDFELPEFEDIAGAPIPDQYNTGNEMISQLELALEKSASFNQDLSLLIFEGESGAEEEIRNSYTYENLIFPLESGKVAVIEINKDLDTSLSATEGFIKEHIDTSGNRDLKVGIASRNGRLISSKRLLHEAESALMKADDEKNIVAFRSDPEKYREYLRDQKN